MRDRDGEQVSARDVLAPDELAQYYRGRRQPRTTGFEHLLLGADPVRIAEEEAGDA
jgi:hypothetical protein